MNAKHSAFYRLVQRGRILSQTAFFLLFLGLLLQTHFSNEDYIGNTEGFFRFDPLLAVSTLFASRTFAQSIALAFISLALTVLFGRFICGWVCPMGSVLQFFSFIFKKSKLHVPAIQRNGLLALKYAIMMVVFVSSMFALDLAGLLDPLSLLYRSFILAVLPAIAVVSESAIALMPHQGMRESLSRSLQDLAIGHTFDQALLIAMIFISLLLLNLLRERFWCRYLCPAGALLGICARRNLVQIKVDANKCTGCNLCTLQCQTQAEPFPQEKWKSGECIYCYTCASACPTAAIRLPVEFGSKVSRPISLGRRRWVLSAVFGCSIVPFFRISGSSTRAGAKLIRPPGSKPEGQFLGLCVKCGECMKVCPTNALQPAFDQAGPEGLWTPVLVPRMGYCEYYCSLCGQVCPTGAIKELKIREKTKIRIGTAWINKNRCLPYILGKACRVCEEKCPTSPKAIEIVETEVMLPNGTWDAQDVPVVNPDSCIGCGICETKCPVADEPAIYCTNFGESRSAQSAATGDLFQ